MDAFFRLKRHQRELLALQQRCLTVLVSQRHTNKEIILTCVRWYVAYPLSSRQLEEMLQERGVAVDHSTIHRWVLQYSPQLKAAFHRR